MSGITTRYELGDDHPLVRLCGNLALSIDGTESRMFQPDATWEWIAH